MRNVIRSLIVFGLMAFVHAGHARFVVDADVQGNVAYFLYNTSAEIVRYDMDAQSFLAAIDLGDDRTASELEVDEDGIFVALEDVVLRYNLDGSNPIQVLSAASDIRELVSSENYLYVGRASNGDDSITSIAKSSNMQVAAGQYADVTEGWSLARGLNRLFGATSFRFVDKGLRSLQLEAAGALPAANSSQLSSPHPDEFPPSDKTYVFPDESRLIDRAGVVFSTDDLSYQSSINGGMRDMVFLHGSPLVLRTGGHLFHYSGELLEQSAAVFANPDVSKIALYDSSIFGFIYGSDSISVEQLALSDLLPRVPGAPVDASTLSYTPDQVVYDGGDTVFLLASEFNSIFRWSLTDGQYLPPISLLDTPSVIQYSASHQALYIGYANGIVNKVADVGEPHEQFFARVPTTLLGMMMADEYVVVVDQRVNSRAYHTFNASGELVERQRFARPSSEYVWNPGIRRFYQLEGGTEQERLFSLPISVAGEIPEPSTAALISPSFSGQFETVFPIVVNASGSRIALTPRFIANGSTMALQKLVPDSFIDAAWIGDELYTINPEIGRVQHWATTGEEVVEVDSFAIDFVPLSLFSDGADLVLVGSDDGGRPLIRRISPSEFVVPPEPEDDFLITFVPMMIAAMNAPPPVLPDPEWAIENRIFCQISLPPVIFSGSTLRVTIDGVTRQSVVERFSGPVDRSAYVVTTPGIKTVEVRFTSSVCRDRSYSFQQEFSPGLRYLLKLVPNDRGGIVFDITTTEIN